MDDEEDGLLTVREVAARLGVDERTVYGYERRGALQAARADRVGLSRRLRFSAEAVAAFAEANGIVVRSTGQASGL
jgi:excisionase family DNA binding protein